MCAAAAGVGTTNHIVKVIAINCITHWIHARMLAEDFMGVLLSLNISKLQTLGESADSKRAGKLKTGIRIGGPELPDCEPQLPVLNFPDAFHRERATIKAC